MRRAIDRRLNIAAPEQPEPGAEVVFNDAWGEPIQRFAFDKLGLPTDIAAILAEAFRHHYAGWSRMAGSAPGSALRCSPPSSESTRSKTRAS
jgi:hypothetical protein